MATGKRALPQTPEEFRRWTQEKLDELGPAAAEAKAEPEKPHTPEAMKQTIRRYARDRLPQEQLEEIASLLFSDGESDEAKDLFNQLDKLRREEGWAETPSRFRRLRPLPHHASRGADLVHPFFSDPLFDPRTLTAEERRCLRNQNGKTVLDVYRARWEELFRRQLRGRVQALNVALMHNHAGQWRSEEFFWASGDLSDHDQAASQTFSDSTFAGTLIGDVGTLFDHAAGGSDALFVIGTNILGTSGFVIGDANAITDHAHGGNDQIVATGGPSTAIGDAAILSGHAQGGDDTVSSTGKTVRGGGAIAYGDALDMTDHAQGGNDTVISAGTAYGDAQTISGFAQGGDDNIFVAGRSVSAYGDAQTITDHGRGGDDLVAVGFASSASLYGDAQTLNGFAVGGNDTLIANTSAQMYGDGAQLLDHAKGGNDTLISGPGND